MQSLFDIKKASPAASSVIALIFVLGIIGTSIVSVNAAAHFSQRIVLDRLYGAGAYENGLRIIRKGPTLSDGRALPDKWMWTINGAIGTAFLVTCIAYIFFFWMLTGFEPGMMTSQKPNRA
jgi:hypothetical protein